MTLKEARNLLPGDQVYWTDPCELDGMEHTSHMSTIQNIEIVGTIICIHELDGGYIECFAHELS